MLENNPLEELIIEYLHANTRLDIAFIEKLAVELAELISERGPNGNS